MYAKELQALERASRLRERSSIKEGMCDLATNDYLGLAHKKKLFKNAVKRVEQHAFHAPKASQFVRGHHQIHADFEALLCETHGFEAALVAGSGFLANLSMIEALPRRRDLLLLDEEYHASGMLASKLVEAQVVIFPHNDSNALNALLETYPHQRAIIAVEGIYSMSGDLMNPEIFQIADKHNALLIVDEAHSMGVVGENLLGVFEYFNITPKPNYIKMGTLGKALGSYGAYILASSEIIQFLQNRAKALIYATAPSLFDIALGHESLLYILENAKELHQKIAKRRFLVQNILGITMPGLILPLHVKSSTEVLKAAKALECEGYLVGAIRPPTVEVPMLRIIPRLGVPKRDVELALRLVRKVLR